MPRILGRIDDLAHWPCAADQQRLGDVMSRWSLQGNAEWLDDGVRQGEFFLQISPSGAGSVLAWELDRLRASGHVAVGPWWVPATWRTDAECYRRVVRLVAEFVLQQPGDPALAQYVPKVRHELEPLLALWPHVLALPTSRSLSIDDMILARAYPVHPLGVVAAPTWADGRWCSPAEFFHHDLDHARFKIREDLLARGRDVPDAYVNGSTLDPISGRHRSILPQVVGTLGPELWNAAPACAKLAEGLLAAIAAESGRELALAARWLLFELVHEKSLPLVPEVLQRALLPSTHVEKLRRKCEHGFYADLVPDGAVIARLDEARSWLARTIESLAP